jgi:GTPase SAR1 family protein
MLCGTKLDLRVDKTSKKSKQFAPITFDSATEIARSIGAVAYSETSALTGAGVEKAFEEVIRIGCMNALLQRTASSDKKCGLM